MRIDPQYIFQGTPWGQDALNMYGAAVYTKYDLNTFRCQ
jgi:hypothetical protein